jgi:biopolymer transport protein ExbB
METTTLGFAHFLSQSDSVGKFLLAVLVLMSVASWYLILMKGITGHLARRRSEAFLDSFWNAPSMDAVAKRVEQRHPDDPFSHLAYHGILAARHGERCSPVRLEEAGGAAEFVTRSLRKTIDEETARMESGLTVLASVGATAPFVGLFGTVWGVYGALVAIGASGAGTLDKVAGPVGEALIMTGLGLAVAIPAVLGYNFLTRSNRVTLARLDAFAHDLYAFLATGERVQDTGREAEETPVGYATLTVRPAATGAR